MNSTSDSIRLLGDWAPKLRPVIFDALRGRLVVNVEGPILVGDTSQYHESAKAGPSMYNNSMIMPPQPGIAILANNHAMDFGPEGLACTKNLLQQSGWLTAGAGVNKQQAAEAVFFQWAGRKAALIARCETQFGSATDTEFGVAAWDSTIHRQISDLKKQVDVVIVSIHAAAEMVPWPSPRRVEAWRSLVDAGADVVHGHHAHVPQGWEEYRGGVIFYGLGNFCVDPSVWSWHPQGLWSLAPELKWTASGIKVTIATTVSEGLGEHIRVRESNDEELEGHMNYFEQCNRPLSDPLLLGGLWQEASVKLYYDQYEHWLNFSTMPLLRLVVRRVRSKLSLLKKSFAGNLQLLTQREVKSQLLLRYHLFACDSHNDAIATALGVLGGELEDLRDGETSRLTEEFVMLRK